jgi:hypothetical protein
MSGSEEKNRSLRPPLIASHFDVSRIPRNVVRTVFVLRVRDPFLEGKHMNSVEDLDVFKLAHQLVLKIYSATKAFPKEELFSLGDQTRRAASRRHSFPRFENSRNVEVSPVRVSPQSRTSRHLFGARHEAR